MKEFNRRVYDTIDDIVQIGLLPLRLGLMLVGYGLHGSVMMVLERFGEACDGRILSSTRKGHPSDDGSIEK